MRDYVETRFTMVRGTIIGFIAGVLPGTGATIGSIVAYSVEKRVAKDGHKFGTGEMRGLVAPEAANNAASAGAMVPLISLGIPGSGSTAVLLGALMMWGLQPGPLLIVNDPGFVWGLIASMYLGNVILIAMNIFAIPLFVRFLDIPYLHIVPVIVLLSVIGAFTVHASMVETWIMVVAGGVGFFMKLYGFSPPALVLALVLGRMAEENLLQSLIISGGSLSIFVQRPISLALTAVIVLSVAAPLIYGLRNRRAAAAPTG